MTTTTTRGSTQHPVAALEGTCGPAAPVRSVAPPRPAEDRERARQGYGTGRTGWAVPLPAEQVAAILERIAS